MNTNTDARKSYKPLPANATRAEIEAEEKRRDAAVKAADAEDAKKSADAAQVSARLAAFCKR